MSREDDVASRVVCTDCGLKYDAGASTALMLMVPVNGVTRGGLPALIGENSATAGAVACGKRNGRSGSEEYGGAAHRNHAIGCDHPACDSGLPLRHPGWLFESTK